MACTAVNMLLLPECCVCGVRLPQVESSDYGALLLRDGAPVAAATLDCFGADVCVIDKLATVKVGVLGEQG